MQKKVIECKVREKSMKKKITIAVVILVIIAIGAARRNPGIPRYI